MAWTDPIVTQAQPMLLRLGLAILAVVLMAVATRLLLGAERRALARTGAHASAQLLLDRLIQFGGLVVAALWVLSIFGVQLTVLVTVVGMAGLAASLALQDVLKNLVAGLYLLVERPFTIGDKIKFRTYTGAVETIELRTTALHTTTGERVVIPNAMIFAEALVNRSAYGCRLVNLRVVIPVRARLGAEHVPAAAERMPTGGTLLSPSSPAEDCGLGRQGADELLRIVRDTGGHVDEPAPRVLLESLTRKKITLRAEVWSDDARAVGTRLAWAVRTRLPMAKVTVLQ